MLRFLLDERHVLALLAALAVLTPLIAWVGAALMKQSKWLYHHRRWYLTVTLSGPLLFLLWFVFNGIENAFGLDSVIALLLNVLLFCLTGIGISYYIRGPGKKN